MHTTWQAPPPHALRLAGAGPCCLRGSRAARSTPRNYNHMPLVALLCPYASRCPADFLFLLTCRSHFLHLASASPRRAHAMLGILAAMEVGVLAVHAFGALVPPLWAFGLCTEQQCKRVFGVCVFGV